MGLFSGEGGFFTRKKAEAVQPFPEEHVLMSQVEEIGGELRLQNHLLEHAISLDSFNLWETQIQAIIDALENLPEEQRSPLHRVNLSEAKRMQITLSKEREAVTLH